MRAVVATFFFFLLLSCTVYGLTYYAGSTLHIPAPNCVNASVYISCTDRIEENEFNVSPNCVLKHNTTTTQDWMCECTRDDEVRIHINPASNNTCEFVISYVSAIEIPERTVVVKRYRYSSPTSVVKNITVYEVVDSDQNETINTIASQISNITRDLHIINETLRGLSTNITAMNTNMETASETINSKFTAIMTGLYALLLLVLILTIKVVV